MTDYLKLFCIFLSLMFMLMLGTFFGKIEGRRECKAELDECVESVESCRTLLNDPHHCVSVLVEALEGAYGTSLE